MEASYKVSNELAKTIIDVGEPIGDFENPFCGTFDGNGAVFIVNADADYAGLFGVCVGATIKNVTICYAEVSGTYFAGGICGLAINCEFFNCTVCGDSYALATNDDYNDGSICGGSIYAGISAGGICGVMLVATEGSVGGYFSSTLNYGAFDYCHSSAGLYSENGMVGGIVGILDTSSLHSSGTTEYAMIYGCYFSGGLSVMSSSFLCGGGYWDWINEFNNQTESYGNVGDLIRDTYSGGSGAYTELIDLVGLVDYTFTDGEVNLVGLAVGSNWKVTGSCVFDSPIFWLGSYSGYCGSGLVTIALIDTSSDYYYDGFMGEYAVDFEYCYTSSGTSSGHMVTYYNMCDDGDLLYYYYDDYTYNYYYAEHIGDYEDDVQAWENYSAFTYWYSGEFKDPTNLYDHGWLFEIIDGSYDSWEYPLPNYSFSIILINEAFDFSSYGVTYPHANIPVLYLATEPIYISALETYDYDIEVDSTTYGIPMYNEDGVPLYDEDMNEVYSYGGWEIYEAYNEYDEACWVIDGDDNCAILGKWACRNLLFPEIPEITYDTYTLTVKYAYYSGTDTITLTVRGYDDETNGWYESKTVSYGSSVTVTCHTEDGDSAHFYVSSSPMAYLQIGSVPTETSYYGRSSFSYYSSGSINVYVVQGYSVSYNDNVTSTYISVPSTQYRIYGGSAITLSSTVPTRNGYTFSSWNTASGGSGTKYSPGGSYSANASATLYAQWTLVSYTLTYNLSGGTYNSSTSNYSVTYTIETSGTLITPTYSGHTFNGWYLSTATGAWSAGTYSAGASYSSRYGDVTLVAQWTSTGYTLTYNLNGGTYNSSTSNYTYSYGSDLTFTLITPTYTGYTFSCWEVTTAAGNWTSGDTYTTETSISGMYGNTTLTAVWTANNAAKYDSTGKYWYVEYGYMPQTKVTSSSTISSLNSSASTTGKSYTMAGVSLVEYVYNSAYYVKFNSNWYQVEAVKWRLAGTSSSTSGVCTTATMATLASIVFVDQYSTSTIGSGSGYSSNSMSHFTTAIKSWSLTIGTSYLSTFSGYIDKFTTSGITSTSTTSGSMLVSSLDEIEDVNGNYAIGFSDLVSDMLTYLGYINSYFTRNLGSNLNNIKCATEGGAVTQRLATNYNGVCFTVKFSEYTCVS